MAVFLLRLFSSYLPWLMKLTFRSRFGVLTFRSRLGGAVITPGTPFLARCAAYLRDYCAARTAETVQGAAGVEGGMAPTVAEVSVL